MNAVDELIDHGGWAIATKPTPIGQSLVRFRTPVLQPPRTKSHPHRLSVLWAFAPENTGALPTDADSAAMETFENRLCNAWEHDGLAVLTAVLTLDGARQWVFYTRDFHECGRLLADMPQDAEPYPIQMTARLDPAWTYLRDEVLKTVEWGNEHTE